MDEIFTHKKEQNILSTISIDEIFDKSYENISVNSRISDMIKIVNESNKTVFAVHDDESLFVGILELNDIRINSAKRYSGGNFCFRSCKTSA